MSFLLFHILFLMEVTLMLTSFSHQEHRASGAKNPTGPKGDVAGLVTIVGRGRNGHVRGNLTDFDIQHGE